MYIYVELDSLSYEDLDPEAGIFISQSQHDSDEVIVDYHLPTISKESRQYVLALIAGYTDDEFVEMTGIPKSRLIVLKEELIQAYTGDSC